MIKRKVLTSLLATPLSLMVIFVVMFGEWKDPLELVVMSLMFCLFLAPYILFYAIPATLISDYITRKLNGLRRTGVALCVHLIFGMSFVLILSIFNTVRESEVEIVFISGVVVAIFFWVIDEIVRRKNVLIDK
ncbi:hypothetical protein CEY16_00580 [Halalkalibacillus sediminis]|uniref:Uncharacterized protein n=1 Tax=Halalkalibacillus sediminis TaxID=2018042 RepID=A0A2I0QVB8_9BACI|nr:hypothetical protein [Halalkalibacillus sediminis]PKR78287.1 hypothetical protein CEY16_00580 [Halalkalibacillus sediminis]